MRHRLLPCVVALACASGSYEKVRASWTRVATDLHIFDTSLDVDVTYRSWEFRQAYAQREIEWFKLQGARAAEVREREATEHAQAAEFLLAVRTHSDSWNDFDAKKSVWRVVLLDDSGRVFEPLDVARIEPITPVQQAFFPYLDTFARGYRVRFPRAAIGDATRTFTLRISGPLGSAELLWEI